MCLSVYMYLLTLVVHGFRALRLGGDAGGGRRVGLVRAAAAATARRRVDGRLPRLLLAPSLAAALVVRRGTAHHAPRTRIVVVLAEGDVAKLGETDAGLSAAVADLD